MFVQAQTILFENWEYKLPENVISELRDILTHLENTPADLRGKCYKLPGNVIVELERFPQTWMRLRQV